MTPELWQRMKPLYDAALKMPGEARAQFIAQISIADPQLAANLEALFKAADEPTTPADSHLLNLQNLSPEHNQSFSVGELVLGRFEIVRHVGTGGMGEVYEATDRELGRVALKTIRSSITANRQQLLRFRKEVQLARRVSNPYVCRIHELFLTDDGAGSQNAFLTMEFLDGITLADKIIESGPLCWPEAKTIAIQLCRALLSIHEAGIIHRDVKCGNIMLTSRNGADCAVLMDFGVARELSSASDLTLTPLTRRGAIVGTPGYMAPEQFEGKELNPATDVYALGIVLYQLVTGKHPFAEDEFRAASRRSAEPLRSPSSLQKGLPHRCDQVIARCLEYDPKRRFQSMKEVEAALEDSTFPRRLRKKWLPVLAGVIGTILVLSSLLLIPPVGERVRGIFFSSREKHIAVLPFDITGSNPETEALGDGLMDSLAGKLSNLGVANQALWVVPASVVRARKVDDPLSAWKQFGATIVIKGSFERNNQDMNLKLTLIDSQKMRDIGYVDVENQNGDLGKLQDEAVTRLGRLMNISVKDNLVRESETSTTPAGYEDYLAGLGYFQRYDKPGNLDRAITSFQDVVKANPRFALGFARLAQAYLMKYRFDSNPQWLQGAAMYGRQAVQLDDRIPAIYVALAQTHELTGNHDLAVQEFQHALDLNPGDADALVGIAAAYRNEGRNSEAEAAYIKAAALRPDDWTGYNALGVFYDDIGRPRDAVAQYRRALELTPDNAGLYTNLGQAYMDSNDPQMLQEAEKALKKSIAISPNFVAWGNLGFLYSMEHRFQESIAASLEANELNNQSYDVWSNLTAAYEWLGQKDKANAAREKTIELLEQAVKLNPQNAGAQATLAAQLAKNGLKDKALDGIRISLALSPNSSYVLSQVADAYELLGDRQNAVQYLKRAIANGFTREQLSADPEIQGVLSDPRFSDAGEVVESAHRKEN